MMLRRIAALSAALVLVGATAASAAGPPYTVAVGGNSAAGTEAVTATSTGTLVFNIRNNAGTLINFNCSRVSGTGTVTRGSGVNPVAQITSTTWTGCRVPGGAATIQQNGSWFVAGTGANATPALTDSITGFVGNVSARVFDTAGNGNIWDFTVIGQAGGTFDESTQQVVINETGSTGNLSVVVRRGCCLGQIQSGNPVNVQAILNITSPNGAINLF